MLLIHHKNCKRNRKVLYKLSENSNVQKYTHRFNFHIDVDIHIAYELKLNFLL